MNYIITSFVPYLSVCLLSSLYMSLYCSHVYLSIMYITCRSHHIVLHTTWVTYHIVHVCPFACPVPVPPLHCLLVRLLACLPVTVSTCRFVCPSGACWWYVYYFLDDSSEGIERFGGFVVGVELSEWHSRSKAAQQNRNGAAKLKQQHKATT